MPPRDQQPEADDEGDGADRPDERGREEPDTEPPVIQRTVPSSEEVRGGKAEESDDEQGEDVVLHVRPGRFLQGQDGRAIGAAGGPTGDQRGGLVAAGVDRGAVVRSREVGTMATTAAKTPPRMRKISSAAFRPLRAIIAVPIPMSAPTKMAWAGV